MTARYYSSEDDDTPAPTCSLQRPAEFPALSTSASDLRADLMLALRDLKQAREDIEKVNACAERWEREAKKSDRECSDLARRVRELELALALYMRNGVQA